MIVDSEINLIPYYPNEAVTFQWYQDKDVCKQVDNIETTYSVEKLRKMYEFLSMHGDCYYIEYKGTLVGDITLRDNAEIAIVVCKEYQNKHIGRKCVKKILELAKEKGLEQVKANIYSFNEQSRKMFLALGFEQVEDEWFVYHMG